MERISAQIGVLLALGACLGTSLGALADAGGPVAVFVVGRGATGSRSVELAVDAVREQLALDGFREVRVPILSAEHGEVGLAAAKALGRSAFSQLATRQPEEVLAEYQGEIDRALGRISSVNDAEGRAVLWNLCALKIHLLLSAGAEQHDSAIRSAVDDCNRRFVERPQLGKSWSTEVARAFEGYAAKDRPAPVTVKSAPAGCDLQLYGASVGVTPTLIDLAPGPYEVRVVCQGVRSAIHRVEVHGPRDLIVRLAADAAYVESGATPSLQYTTAEAAKAVEEDAATLALEAGAESFVLVDGAVDGTATVRWIRSPGSRAGEGHVRLDGSRQQRADAVKHIFHPDTQQARATSVAPVRKRSWADYTLGGSLLAAGVGLAVYPMLAIARDGHCVDANCESVYRGKNAAGIVTLTAAGILAAGGVAIIWVGPFGRRTAVSVGTGITVRGAF